MATIFSLCTLKCKHPYHVMKEFFHQYHYFDDTDVINLQPPEKIRFEIQFGKILKVDERT